MAAPINTRNFAWKDIEIRLQGNVLTSVEGVSWTPKQEKEAIYGAGVDPLAIKSGNKITDGSLALLQDELERLLDASPDGTILGFEGLDIQVAFVDKGIMVRYSITGVSFTEEPHNHQQNDKRSVSQLPFLALGSRRVA